MQEELLQGFVNNIKIILIPQNNIFNLGVILKMFKKLQKKTLKNFIDPVFLSGLCLQIVPLPYIT